MFSEGIERGQCFYKKSFYIDLEDEAATGGVL